MKVTYDPHLRPLRREGARHPGGAPDLAGCRPQDRDHGARRRFGKPALTVGTDVARLARRVGWTAQTNPDKIEQDVAALLPAQ
jgi:hypothetical protein